MQQFGGSRAHVPLFSRSRSGIGAWGPERGHRNVLEIIGLLAVMTVIGSCGGDTGPMNPVAPGTTFASSVVVMETSLGTITIGLYQAQAPKTVENFLAYVSSGFYDGTIFHRVIPGFVIQGGGLTTDLNTKATRGPVENEATNGLKNTRGTIAMARTSNVNSATSQFFINIIDNAALDHRSTQPSEFGFAVFGMVTEGMDVVDAISTVPTGTRGSFSDVPSAPVVIQSVRIEM